MKILFADRLKSLRTDANIKQSQLAETLGTTQRKVSYWESGKIEPDLESLWKISNYFDVSIDYLVGKEN